MIGKGYDCLSPLYLRNPDSKWQHDRYLRVRCGHCVYCKMARTQEWMLRLQCESRYWNNISFVTLTYDEQNVPWSNFIEEYDNGTIEEGYIRTLYKRDLQLFLKRLRESAQIERKCFPKSRRCVGIRYYAVGEYGEGRNSTFRPHYHLIIFGYGNSPEQAALIEKCWGKGFVTVDPFFPETCAYVAGYVQKKLYGHNELYMGRLPEFLCCSKHLGEEWILEHQSLFSDEHAYMDVCGYKKALPRYFRQILVKLGVLKDMSVSDLALQQNIDFNELKKHLIGSGISERDFFRQRYKNALAKENKFLSKRYKV